MAQQFIRKLDTRPNALKFEFKNVQCNQQPERKQKPSLHTLTVLLPSFDENPPPQCSSPEIIRRKTVANYRSRTRRPSEHLFTPANYRLNPNVILLNSDKKRSTKLYASGSKLNLNYKTLILDSSTSSNAKKLHPISKSHELETKSRKMRRVNYRVPARKLFNNTWMDNGLVGSAYYVNPVQRITQKWSHTGIRVLKRELDRNSLQSEAWCCNSPNLNKNEIDDAREIEQEIKLQQEKKEKEARQKKVVALWRYACSKIIQERKQRKNDVTKQLWTIYEELLKINKQRKDAEMKSKVSYLTTQFNKIMHNDDWAIPGEKRTENLALDMEKIKADTIRGIHQKIEDASDETDREEMLRTLGNLTCSTVEQDRMLYIHTARRKPKLAKRNPFANIAVDGDSAISAAQKTKSESLIAEFLQKENSKLKTKKTHKKWNNYQ